MDGLKIVWFTITFVILLLSGVFTIIMDYDSALKINLVLIGVGCVATLIYAKKIYNEEVAKRP